MRPWGHEILLPYGLVTARPPYHEESYPGEKNCQEYKPNGKYVKLEKAGAFEGVELPGWDPLSVLTRVLDLGCGGGWFSIHFAQKGFSVLAVDQSSKAIEKLEFLKEILDLPKIRTQCREVGKATWVQAGKYNIIMMLGLLHHLPEEDLPNLIRCCHYALNRDGVLVIETKPEVPCEELLTQAKFVPRKLRGAPRSSWRGEKKHG